MYKNLQKYEEKKTVYILWYSYYLISENTNDI